MSGRTAFVTASKGDAIDPPGSREREPLESKTPWELYNERARIYDREVIKEWEGNLSIQLVFAALFSAILTAFIIVSLSILQDDNQETMKDILLVISKQLNNATVPPYEISAFQPPSWAVQVNILFFTSLGCNLFAAFASVLALQWVREYDMGLSGITEPRERALRRQLRLEGMKHWLMPEIISMLIPTLLHIALLFFIGALLVWLIQIHTGIAYTMLVTLAITTSFYIGTQVISSMNPSVPYKTPLSRKLERIWSSVTRLVKLNLWEIYTEEPKSPRNTRRLTGHHSSELEAVRTSRLLPSSALFWVLNHIDHSERLVHDLLDICHHLFEPEQSSTLAQIHPQDLVHWSTIIDNVAQYLDTLRQYDNKYPEHVNDCFLTLFCGLAVFGRISTDLSPSTWLILTRGSFKQFSLQSTPLGLTCRFALWRNGRGFPMDIPGPPVDLFRQICLHYGRVPDLIAIITLQEVRNLFDNGLLTSKDIMEYLRYLLHSSDSNNGIAHLFKNENIAAEVLVTMSTLLKIPSADSTRIEPVIQISNIFDACTGARDRSINTNGRSDDIIYLILPQILYDLTQGQDDNLVLEKFGLLRHPAVSSAWLDETVNNQFDRTNSIINEYFWDEARPLYPKRGPRTPVFSVELVHSILALLSRLPRIPSVGSEAWHMMSSSLMTLGCCISGQPYDERLVRRAPEHDPVLWIARLLGCLKPGMNDPTLAFLISALLMGHVRRLYGRSLHCAPSAEGRDQIRGIDDSLLCLISCLLLGWEFEDFLPAWGDPVWRTPALKVAMDYKNGFGPYILYASDIPLLLAMCSHADEYLENKALWFLTKYTEISLFANQSDMHARKATAEELLKTALPLFSHFNNRQCYQIKLIARWSLRDLFLRPLLDLGGLEWLSGLTLPWPEDCTNCFRFTSPVDGMVLFLRHQIQVHELTPENLPEAQSKLLLESPLLRETFPNSDAHKYIFMVKIIFDHLKELGCSELCFPDTATKCEEVILWDEPQQQRCWEQSRQVLGLIGEGDLEGWMEGLRELVDELRTGKSTLIRTSRFGYSVSPLTGPLDSLDPLTGQRGKERFRMHWRKVGGHAT